MCRRLPESNGDLRTRRCKVLVSALTTVLVFIPILTLNLEIGQLFRDIAVAISVSVLLSGNVRAGAPDCDPYDTQCRQVN